MPTGTWVVNKIKEAKAFGADSGTETVDLPTANYLGTLILRVQNTNGSTSNTAGTIEAGVTKIEVIADGIVVYQATGVAARKFEQFDIGHLPPYDEIQTGSAVQYAVFPIKFGRARNDKDLVLPAHLFTTLQLRITYSFTDNASTGWTTSESNAKYDLLSRVLVSNEVVNSPFLKKIEHFSNTLNTAQEEDVDLPVGAGSGAYRRIMVYAREASIGDGTDIDKYELIVNDSQRVVNELWNTSQMEDDMRYGANNDKAVTIMASDGTTYNCGCTRILSVSCQSQDDDDVVATADHAVATDDLITMGMVDDAGTTLETADSVDLIIKAPGVSNATMVDLGTDDINDSLNVGAGSGVSSLKLKLNVAATGALTKVMSEQLVVF